jgi:hypothetical protein
LEQTSRELLSLQDRKVAIVDAALGAAVQAFAGGEGSPHTGAEALKADLARSSQDVAAEISRALETRAREVQAVLTDATNANGAPAPGFEPLGRHRETPLLDLPPLSLDLKPPLWARANQHLLRRWIAERVRDAWQPAVERAVDAYFDVLRRWATDGLTRLRREFEGQSRPLLTQLTGVPTGGGAKGSMTTNLQRDLAWLVAPPGSRGDDPCP